MLPVHHTFDVTPADAREVAIGPPFTSVVHADVIGIPVLEYTLNVSENEYVVAI